MDGINQVSKLVRIHTMNQITKQFVLGAHWLSVAFALRNYTALQLAMEITVKNGGKIFEIPFILCEIGWEKVAMAANAAGIKEISFCHLWPYGPDGKPVCGDPLGTSEDVKMALATIDRIIEAAEIIRAGGIEVRFISGPTWGGLGKEYSGDKNARDVRVVEFLRQAGDKCKKAGLILAVEFLRPVEDKVIGGTVAMVRILQLVNHPAVMMHFDVFHSIECGEDLARSILYALKFIAYLHLHGDGRLAPGQEGDKRNWPSIIDAAKQIDSGVENIPVVSEPFGQQTCEEEPALGIGLPPMLPFGEYLPLAFGTLRAAGLPLAA